MSSWWDTLSSAYSAVAETVAADSEAVNDDSNATATVTKKETGDYLLSITIENDADEVLEGDKVQTGGSNIFHVQVPASKAGMLEEIKVRRRLYGIRENYIALQRYKFFVMGNIYIRLSTSLFANSKWSKLEHFVTIKNCLKSSRR